MIWMIIAAACAFFVKGLCGFANTLVFTTILSFHTTNINISPVELILGYPSNLMIAWKERRSIQWKVCIPLALLVLGGNIPGILLLKNADTQIIKVVFGFAVILIGVEMLLRERQNQKLKQSKILLSAIGFLSGILCGLYGIGALLAAYVSRVTDNSRSFKANICIVFIAENTFRIILYCLTGIITFSTLSKALVLVPAMLAGLLLGIKSCTVLDETLVRRLVIVMLILSGISLVVQNM